MSRNGAPPPAHDAVKASARWWLAEDDDLASALTAVLQFLKDHQQQRLTQWVISTRLYGNMMLVGRGGVTFSRVASTQPWLKERISWNCVQATSDTVVSRMVKNKPKPLFLSSGGDYKIQRRAKLLNKFVEGVFYENDAYAKGTQALLDSMIWGDGVIHIYPENKRVKYERVIASELWVDELDGFYGEPRSLHRSTDVDREVLLERLHEWEKDSKEYDRKALKVTQAPISNPDNAADFIADKVEVIESWHLPSGPNAEDGRHVITVLDCVLVDEKYDHDFFPFVFLPWCKRLYGFWSQGLAEQLQNIQLEINTILATIKQSFWKGGTFRVFLPVGSKVVKDHITNQIGSIVSYTGSQAPVVVTPQLVQPEIFQHLSMLWQKAFEQAGVSQLAAASLKPAGLNSGIALREYNDIQTDRFQTIGKRYEAFYLDLARVSIAVVKDIVKGRGSYRVSVPSKGKFIEEVDWKDVDLSEDEYVLQCFPISALPTDPAGRLEQINEWVQAGWIAPRQGRRLMDFPDLEMAENLANAAEDYLTEILEKMVDEGIYTKPEPYDDLDLAQELALEVYQRGKFQHVEDAKLDLVRRFLKEIQGYKDIPAAAANQTAMNQPVPPPAAPQPAPQSPLLPNVKNLPPPPTLGVTA